MGDFLLFIIFFFVLNETQWKKIIKKNKEMTEFQSLAILLYLRKNCLHNFKF